MRFVTLVKLTLATPQGQQTKYFFSPRDAAFYIEAYKIPQFLQEAYDALQEGNTYYLADFTEKLVVERPLEELTRIKEAYDDAVAQATRTIAATQRPQAQRTLFQMWSQPPVLRAPAANPPAPSSDDPMDLDKPATHPGYSYWSD